MNNQPAADQCAPNDSLPRIRTSTDDLTEAELKRLDIASYVWMCATLIGLYVYTTLGAVLSR